MVRVLFVFTILLSSPLASSFATIPKSSTTLSSLKRNTSSLSSSKGRISSTGGTSLRMQGETRNIAVVGCGVLGTSLCKQLLIQNKNENENNSSSRSITVTGLTKTTSNHASIKASIEQELLTSSSSSSSQVVSNFNLSTFDDIPKNKQFTDIVFCAPPSGFENYPQAIQNVIDELWAGSSKGGTFVFTSSGGIYGPGNGEVVSETSTLPQDTSSSPRMKRLVESELNVIAAGGCVLRLAGLYTLERGAHNYWLEKSGGQVKGSKDGIINLLHYDDAAGACLAALSHGDNDVIGGKIFLISDGHPTTRYGICASTLKSKRYSEASIPTFGEDQGNAAGKGKIYDGSWSNEVLGWKPRYTSFDEFMANSQ